MSGALPSRTFEAQRCARALDFERWDRPLFTLVGFRGTVATGRDQSCPVGEPGSPPISSHSPSHLLLAAFCTSWTRSPARCCRLMEAQKSAVPGDLLKLPGTTEHLVVYQAFDHGRTGVACQSVYFLHQMHPNNENLPQLANMFLQYLSQSLH